MIIAGFDTALRTTGYGLIEVTGKRLRVLDCGVVRSPQKVPLSECLRRLAGGVEELIASGHPTVAALEGGFFARNAQTSMKLGMARGVVVSHLATHGIPVHEYAPRRAKQVVVGFGGASKPQVAAMMANLLAISVTDIPDDATDALALAVCHAMMMQTLGGLHVPPPL